MTNQIEGVFSIFKRGMKGVYQHCAEKHLHRYLNEFSFRYNHRVALGCNDVERNEQLLRGIAGKRLTYRRMDDAAHSSTGGQALPALAKASPRGLSIARAIASTSSVKSEMNSARPMAEIFPSASACVSASTEIAQHLPPC